MTPTDDLHDLARVFDTLADTADATPAGSGNVAHAAAGLATAYRRAAGMARYLADNPGGYAGAVVPMTPGADGKGVGR